jgi:hypothetical protein
MPTPPSPKLEDDTASVVLLGYFNPVIFQPAWFAAKGLIREAEAAEATVEMIHPEVTSFRAGWLSLSVTRDRFIAMSSDTAQHVALRDLVVATFQLLEHTPTSRLGLNRAMHFSLYNEQKWHLFGHMVAPKEPWTGIAVEPGLLSLSMQSKRDDGLSGRIIFRVEPSLKHRFAAFIDVNNELVPKRDADKSFSVTSEPRGDATPELIDLVRAHWDRVIQVSLERAQKLLAKTPGETNA